ncbi:formylglycine-generating enzyme family protein [Candidatus Poribacteria bacterium]|nr:formylglycine-generating enzyme family protein [Candidatus Poribacteria bacterium]
MKFTDRIRSWFSTPPVSTPTDAVQTPPTTPKVLERINPKDGAAMVYIPEGKFIMGTSDAQIDTLLKRFPDWDRSWFNGEKPQHRVYLDGYWIYKHEVTVAQYRKFCRETGHRMPNAPSWGWHDDHPIVDVTWYDAAAYCQWAGVALPTEAQWEKAARGTDGRIWPWGNEWDKSKCNSYESGIEKTSPVGSYPSGASPYGLMDMAGNVLEWCMDEWDSGFYAKSSSNNPVAGRLISFVNNNFTNVKTDRSLRSGCWLLNPCIVRVANRYNLFNPTNSLNCLGFRCAGPVTP